MSQSSNNNQAGKRLDARGLACPAPVLMTREAIEKNKPRSICVIVDNQAACENVMRFLQSKNFQTESEKRNMDFYVTGTKESLATAENAAPVEKDLSRQEKIMVMVATDRMGYGDKELGKKLMINFIKTLKEMGPELWRLVFVNNGVKLAVENSPVLDDLLEYEEEGLSILVCGTCLTHFDLMEKKEVGTTTNMLDIVTAMQTATKVINI